MSEEIRIVCGDADKQPNESEVRRIACLIAKARLEEATWWIGKYEMKFYVEVKEHFASLNETVQNLEVS